MELSSQGVLLTWFGLAMVIVGIVFSNPLTILLAGIGFAYLVLRAAVFSKLVRSLTDRISIKLEPPEVSTLANVDFKLDTVITNDSHIPTIIGTLRLALPQELESETREDGDRMLAGGLSLRYERSLKATAPGLFEISEAKITLRDKSRLLRHALTLNCSMIIEVKPRLSTAEPKIDTADPTRLGAGADLAGIREAVSDDDFRVIDWKSTARTGKFMVREFYRETDVPAMIIVDSSLLTYDGPSKSDTLLSIARLIVAFGASTRVGMIIYDDQQVITSLPASAGYMNSQRLLAALVAATGRRDTTGPSEYATRMYWELNNMIRTMRVAETSRDHPRGRPDMVTSSVLPYYENASAKYSLKLREQGAFRALQMLSTISQPTLIVAISEFRKDLSGLFEGALMLNASGHRVIIAVIGSVRHPLPIESLTIRQSGIQVFQGSGARVFDEMRKHVLTIPRIRTKSTTR